MQEQEIKKMTKDQLKVIALSQRIGEITSNYEERFADMRADVTQNDEDSQDKMVVLHKEIQRLMQVVESKNNEVDELNRKLDDFQSQATNVKKSTK